MGSTPRLGSVGGITRVMLHHPSTPLPQVGVQIKGSIPIPLLGSGSSYSEQRISDYEFKGVQHTLTLTIDPDCPIATMREMERIVESGVVADLILSSGLQIRVGWSERYGVAFPLRLTSVQHSSGSQQSDTPTKKWIFSSIDTNSLL